MNNNTLQYLLFFSSSSLLISYNGESISQIEFREKVLFYAEEFKQYDFLDDFILIYDENPIHFYILLFALWVSDKKVIFPTKDLLLDKELISFYKYSCLLENNQIIIKENKNFCKLENAIGDTVLFSSGSTGKPKGILHKKENFIKNAYSVFEKISQSNYTSISYLKPYLVSALSHFLVHFISNSQLIFDDYKNTSNIDKYIQKHPDLSIVGSPMHLITAFGSINNDKYKPRLFFSSGDILNDLIIDKIINKYIDIIVFNVYGLAELGGRLFVNRIDGTTPINNRKQIGESISGSNVKIENDTIVVKADFLFYGYIIDNKFIVNNEWFNTKDTILLDNYHTVLAGRTNDEIKVGGNKVALKYLENKISGILNIEFLVITSKRHALFGNLIVLVIKGDSNLSRRNILIKLNASLEQYEIPHEIYTIEEIPFTQTMKIDRKSITESLSNLKQLTST
ncbi:AMP-binding protein [Sulfurimonas aquatica]|uniref:AMP-binding protein n=1 Tax=Sulfurimonas aquatica TaxID=2672570 RepID=A0A975AZ60_9BACT|nr:class I adenylate-forming enzyme family protein [Sulfurimonas aquatica]QSZ41234.1 AMP-binding protein [Sulfurimonas aquatica]